MRTSFAPHEGGVSSCSGAKCTFQARLAARVCLGLLRSFRFQAGCLAASYWSMIGCKNTKFTRSIRINLRHLAVFKLLSYFYLIAPRLYMNTFITTLLFAFVLSVAPSFAQNKMDKALFNDTSVINATLSMNLKKILANVDKQGKIFPATFSCKIGDSLNVNDPISLEVRGHFRRGYCYLPPLKMIFKDHPNTTLYKLKSLKLVSSCMLNVQDDQNLLKEYMCYKK